MTTATARVQTTTSKVPITVSITNENGILLSFDADSSRDLPAGSWPFDVMADVYNFSGTETTQELVVKGTLVVAELDNITPLEASDAMEIKFKRREDYRQQFVWYDSAGDVLTIQSAYMQAVDATGTTVLDLRWFAAVPSEATVLALPAIQRGYLAPASEKTLELHVSNANTIAAGTYPFDIFVQDLTGDWSNLAAGNVVVEASISSPPA